MTKRKFLLLSVALCGGSALACTPGSDSSGSGPNSGLGTGGNAGSGGDATGNGGASGNGGYTGPDFGDGLVSPDAGVSTDSPCAENVLEPEAVEEEVTIEQKLDCTSREAEPIALYIVLDNSGSMDDNGKWEAAVNAITAFVNDQSLTGGGWVCLDEDGTEVPPPADLPPAGTSPISVAIQYFHPVGTNGDSCDGSGHGTPAVPMGELPDNAVNITNSLASTGPSGDTPTVGALTGGVAYCQDYQATNPDVRCVTVLVTDGQPNGCGLDSGCDGFLGGNDCVDTNAEATLTPIASTAYNDPNSVVTFTIGMEGVSTEGFALLDAIAVAGGSDCTPTTPGSETCNATSGAQGFLDALNTIRNSVTVSQESTQSFTSTQTVTTTLPCEWAIPEPDPGEVFDKGRVNVNVAIGGTGEQTLGNVADVEDCALVGGGWYYDDPDEPARIHACPGTCTLLESATDVRVNVLVGCVTKPAMVR